MRTRVPTTTLAAVLAATLTVLTACAGPQARRETADALAAPAGLTPRLYRAGAFSLAGWLRNGGTGPLVVYVEGDGHAWVSPTRPSSDPTPRNPVALRLAAVDPAPRLLYLARPCQYTGATAEAGCDARFWTSHRFAPEVIDALDRAVDAAKRDSGATRLVLAGYSGGPAARRRRAADGGGTARPRGMGAAEGPDPARGLARPGAGR